jgi:hypothetical protein
MDIDDKAHEGTSRQRAEALVKRKPAAWGARGRQFESARPDHFFLKEAR